MDKNQDIREAYTVFFSQVMHSFNKRKVDPMVIRSLANSYGQALSEAFAVSSNNDNIVTVFYEFSRQCTWFNYELLRVVLKIEGNDVEKECLKTYECDYLIPYLNLSIFEIPCTPSADPSRTHLLFKVSADLCITGNQVKAIQRNLAKLLGFEHCAILHFEDYNEGCIELVFSLPTAVLNISHQDSPLLSFIEWEESRSCYKVTADLVTVLSCSDKPEVSNLCYMLQDALKQQSSKSKNEESEFERLLDPKELREKSIQVEYSESLLKKLKEIIIEKEVLMNELMNNREEFFQLKKKKYKDKWRAVGQILIEMGFGSRSSSLHSSSQSRRHSRPKQYMESFPPSGPSSSTSSLEQNY